MIDLLFYVDEEEDLLMLLGTDNDIESDWENGIFYVSYYDTSIAYVPSVAYIINNDTYNRIYQINVGGIGEWSSNAKWPRDY